MTTDHVAVRTLVKSPPELWAECSDAALLARHIGEFGEITITRLDPETSVTWEAERASGTVVIEPSAWGTRVTLTAQTTAEDDSAREGLVEVADEAAPDAEPETEPAQEELHAKVEEAVSEPDLAVAADPAPARGRLKRMIERTRTWFRPPVDELAPLPEGIVVEPATPPVQVAAEPDEAEPDEAPVDEAPVEAAKAPLDDAPDASEGDGRVDAEAVLSAALDSLGQAHHRPFSRA